MNKRILMSSAAIVAAVGLVAGSGTFASLLDVDDNNGNKLQAGTMFLLGDTESGDNVAQSASNTCDDWAEDDYMAGLQTPPFDNFRPRPDLDGTQNGGPRVSDGSYQEAFKVICLQNGGSVDGDLSAVLPSGTVLNFENGRNEAEIEAGDGTADVGEFGDQVLLSYIKYEPSASGTCDVYGGTTASDSGGYINDREGSDPVELGSLGAGDTTCVALKFSWTPPGSETGEGSDAMSDITQFDIQWILNQASGGAEQV